MDKKEFRKILWTTSKYIDILTQEWFDSPEKLLWYFPRTYEDRSDIRPLDALKFDDTTEITKAKVTNKSMVRTGRWKRLITIQLHDENDQKCMANFLNNSYMLKKIQNNTWYYIVWKPQKKGNAIAFWHPEMIEAIESAHLSWKVWWIYPIYSDLQGIKSSRFSKKIPPLVKEHVGSLNDSFPEAFYKKYDLLPVKEMITTLHRPETIEHARQAKKTLFFKRMVRIQINSLIQKKNYQAGQEFDTLPVDRDIIKQFLDTLPFTLTNAQKVALKDIIENIHETEPMLRLLQWDVWSWKTVVAAAAAWYIIQKFDGQVAFLAPLAVLANQHHATLAKLLLPLWVNIQCITWATKKTHKEKIKRALKAGSIDCIVGTHALLQEDVHFKDLHLAIIDEQHKFWVRQRAYLQRHGSPHLLQMTATPIPRSMALAFFGEFAVSTIDEMPSWRKPITTKIISQQEFIKLKPRLLTKIQQWQKVFLVTPLIEESEALEGVKSATNHRQEITQIFSELNNKIWLLHGKMKPSEKDAVMEEFKNGKYVMLVSTTVIEVWIDIPEATVMIIYNAERFGLSQLHQLRWRVWRSDIQSYCFLETPKKSWETYKRLKHMEQTTDGFELSEIDLKYRWPWEFLWVRQSWDTDVPLELLTDTTLLETVQDAAHRLLSNPDISPSSLSNDASGSMENLLV